MPDVPGSVLERARRGDDDALEALVRAAYPAVRRWTLVQTGDAAEADDLTQDVLIRMIQKLDSFHGDAQFGTWLYSVTRNAATDRFRKQARRRRLATAPTAFEDLVPTGPEDPMKAVERREVSSLVRLFFAELPDRQREVFDLVELQGLSAAEASEMLGIEPVSVRANLFKARKRLRTRILEARPEVAEDVV